MCVWFLYSHLWRRNNDMDVSVRSLSGEVDRCERDMRGRMSRGLSQAIDIVREVVEERGIRGYYGLLIDTFQCEPKMYTAVETVAGNR